MNQKELKIIAYLRQNARMPLTTMSKKISVPVSTIFDRLKATEGNYIVKHTSLLDFGKLGYSIKAKINLKVEKEDRERIKEYLLRCEHVNSVYRITNGYDYMIEGIFAQIKDMELFIDALESMFKISDVKSFFVIEDLKREGFMSDPNLVGW